ncbi:hypothetical protein I7I53_10507 [Histoplasma capsulatum var. duboisii H88]|uniref:Uncharacterized protein n=1 Tax=Ajellomyces capsulatus (strain H88) TaxID=544711 RepID=A0A8A1LBC2_AJEC8|nr:hypothetical protein I7I53_10507 [Histoplasma capsulatum var. duboisii H88]
MTVTAGGLSGAPPITPRDPPDHAQSAVRCIWRRTTRLPLSSLSASLICLAFPVNFPFPEDFFHEVFTYFIFVYFAISPSKNQILA